jgi:hypothetical protein
MIIATSPLRFGAALLLACLICAPALAACLKTSPKKLVLQGELARDRQSGLVWKRCAVGQEWNTRENRCNGSPTGLNQKEARLAAQRAGPGWRVPTGSEMETLRVNACRGPKIDVRVFPDIVSADFGEGANFWTSSAALPGTFYFFDFTDGSVDFHSDGFTLSVLLVKNEFGKSQ